MYTIVVVVIVVVIESSIPVSGDRRGKGSSDIPDSGMKYSSSGRGEVRYFGEIINNLGEIYN